MSAPPQTSPGSAGLPPGPHPIGAAPGNAGLTPGPRHDGPQPHLAPPLWRSHGYLPHRDEVGRLQSITYRLADSLPQEKLRQLEATLAAQPAEKREVARRQQVEAWLDAGLGCCALRHPALAAIVEAAFFHADGERYRLLAWCIMPNHVHALIQPYTSLADIVRTWKSHTGRGALAHSAKLQLGLPGKTLWMREYWDRYIRDERHLRSVLDYIHENPVKAGLASTAAAWPWSSARHLPQPPPMPGGSPALPGAPGSRPAS